MFQTLPVEVKRARRRSLPIHCQALGGNRQLGKGVRLGCATSTFQIKHSRSQKPSGCPSAL